MPFNLFSIAEIVTRPAFCEFERIPLIVADGKWFMTKLPYRSSPRTNIARCGVVPI
jgi:hypothetical protein